MLEWTVEGLLILEWNIMLEWILEGLLILEWYIAKNGSTSNICVIVYLFPMYFHLFEYFYST